MNITKIYNEWPSNWPTLQKIYNTICYWAEEKCPVLNTIFEFFCKILMFWADNGSLLCWLLGHKMNHDPFIRYCTRCGRPSTFPKKLESPAPFLLERIGIHQESDQPKGKDINGIWIVVGYRQPFAQEWPWVNRDIPSLLREVWWICDSSCDRCGSHQADDDLLTGYYIPRDGYIRLCPSCMAAPWEKDIDHRVKWYRTTIGFTVACPPWMKPIKFQSWLS